MILYRSRSVYKLGGPKIEVKMEAKIGVEAQKTVDIRIKILLFLLKTFLISLSLLAEVELWQVYSLTIFLKVNYKVSVSSSQ